MDELIEKLIKYFKNIEPEDNEKIKMAIMELDNEYQQIQNFGADNVNNKLLEQNFKIVFHDEFPKGLKFFSFEEC